MTTIRDESIRVLADALYDSTSDDGIEPEDTADDARIILADPTLGPRLDLGTAWFRVVNALPEGWHQSLHQPNVPGGKVVWRALAVEWSLLRPMPVTAEADTPTAALEALAEALEAMR